MQYAYTENVDRWTPRICCIIQPVLSVFFYFKFEAIFKFDNNVDE